MASSTYCSHKTQNRGGTGSPAAALPALAAALALAAAIAAPAVAQEAQGESGQADATSQRTAAQTASSGVTEAQATAALPSTAYEVVPYGTDTSSEQGVRTGLRTVATPDFTLTLDGDPGVVYYYEWSFADYGEGAGCALEVRNERYGIRYTVDCVPEGADPEEGAPYDACAVRTAGPAMRDEGRAVRLCVEAPGRGEGDLAWASDVADAVLPYVSVDPADVPGGLEVTREDGATVARTDSYEVRMPDADFPQGVQFAYKDGYNGFGEGIKYADDLAVNDASGDLLFYVSLTDKKITSGGGWAAVDLGAATFEDLDMRVTVMMPQWSWLVDESMPLSMERTEALADAADLLVAQYAQCATALPQAVGESQAASESRGESQSESQGQMSAAGAESGAQTQSGQTAAASPAPVLDENGDAAVTVRTPAVSVVTPYYSVDVPADFLGTDVGSTLSFAYDDSVSSTGAASGSATVAGSGEYAVGHTLTVYSTDPEDASARTVAFRVFVAQDGWTAGEGSAAAVVGPTLADEGFNVVIGREVSGAEGTDSQETLSDLQERYVPLVSCGTVLVRDESGAWAEYDSDRDGAPTSGSLASPLDDNGASPSARVVTPYYALDMPSGLFGSDLEIDYADGINAWDPQRSLPDSLGRYWGYSTLVGSSDPAVELGGKELRVSVSSTDGGAPLGQVATYQVAPVAADVGFVVSVTLPFDYQTEGDYDAVIAELEETYAPLVSCGTVLVRDDSGAWVVRDLDASGADV